MDIATLQLEVARGARCPTCVTLYHALQPSRSDEADHRPRLLPCSHTLCSHCVQTLLHVDTRCPLCQTPFAASSVTDVPLHSALIEHSMRFAQQMQATRAVEAMQTAAAAAEAEAVPSVATVVQAHVAATPALMATPALLVPNTPRPQAAPRFHDPSAAQQTENGLQQQQQQQQQYDASAASATAAVDPSASRMPSLDPPTSVTHATPSAQQSAQHAADADDAEDDGDDSGFAFGDGGTTQHAAYGSASPAGLAHLQQGGAGGGMSPSTLAGFLGSGFKRRRFAGGGGGGGHKTESMTPARKLLEIRALEEIGFVQASVNDDDVTSMREPHLALHSTLLKQWLTKMQLQFPEMRRQQTVKNEFTSAALVQALTVIYACQCGRVKYGQKSKSLHHIINKHSVLAGGRGSLSGSVAYDGAALDSPARGTPHSSEFLAQLSGQSAHVPMSPAEAMQFQQALLQGTASLMPVSAHAASPANSHHPAVPVPLLPPSSLQTEGALPTTKTETGAQPTEAEAEDSTVRTAGAPADDLILVCAQCGISGDELMQCSACLNAVYCGQRCQKQHWKLHKDDCKKAQQQQQQQQPSTGGSTAASTAAGAPALAASGSMALPPTVAGSVSAAVSGAVVAPRSYGYGGGGRNKSDLLARVSDLTEAQRILQAGMVRMATEMAQWREEAQRLQKEKEIVRDSDFIEIGNDATAAMTGHHPVTGEAATAAAVAADSSSAALPSSAPVTSADSSAAAPSESVPTVKLEPETGATGSTSAPSANGIPPPAVAAEMDHLRAHNARLRTELSFLRSSHQSLERRLSEWQTAFKALLPAQAQRQTQDLRTAAVEEARRSVARDVQQKLRRLADRLGADASDSGAAAAAAAFSPSVPTRAAGWAHPAAGASHASPYPFAPPPPLPPPHTQQQQQQQAPFHQHALVTATTSTRPSMSGNGAAATGGGGQPEGHDAADADTTMATGHESDSAQQQQQQQRPSISTPAADATSAVEPPAAVGSASADLDDASSPQAKRPRIETPASTTDA